MDFSDADLRATAAAYDPAVHEAPIVVGHPAASAPANHRPVDRAASQITDYIMLDREVRTAQLVFDADSYAPTNRVALAGQDQWSDHENSDPIEDVMTGLDACLMRPNVMAIGQGAFTKLSMHPKINRAIHGTSGDMGIQTRQAIAGLFELEEAPVGKSRLNTAKKGQSASLSRVWGNHCAPIYRDRNADTRSGLTFGYTAQFGGRVAGSWPDRNIGLRDGGDLYRGLDYEVDSGGVALGSNATYAAIQQLGGTDDMAPGPAATPARPFLGLSDEDQDTIAEVFSDFLQRAGDGR